MSAFTFPFGPTVTLPLPKSSFPSTVPSTNRSSLPVISPLILIPWAMHAEARGDTGSAEDNTEPEAGPLLGLGCGTLAAEGTGAGGTPCGFTSSFLHMRHLDGHSWIFEVVGLEGGATQNLEDSTGFSACKGEWRGRNLGCSENQYPTGCSFGSTTPPRNGAVLG